MKKKYMKPVMQVFNLHPHGIICTSNPKNSNRMVDDSDWIWDEDGGQ